MIVRTFIAAAALLLATPALAGKPIKAGALVADPALGYILVRLGPDHNAAISLQRYAVDHGNVVLGKPGPNILSKKELDAAFVGGGNFIAETPDSRTYVVAARPGTWLIAGAGVTCFSLGSYGFEVKAGQVTDIGTVLTGLENGKSPVPEIAAAKLSQDLVDFGVVLNVVMSNAMLVRPATGSDAVPMALGGMTLRRAALIPDVRFANTCQTLVNRAIGLPPLEHQASFKQAPAQGQ